MLIRILSLAVVIMVAFGVFAQTPDEANKEEAKKHFELGKAYYKQSEYTKAIEEFQKAYSLYAHSVILYNIAQAYEKEGNIPMALRFFREYLRASPNAEDRNTILISIQNLEKKLQERGIQQVGIYSTPSEADVAINGKVVGKTPFVIELKPGKYTLSLTKKGYMPIDKEFIVSPDKSLELDFSLNEVNVEQPKPQVVSEQKVDQGLVQKEDVVKGPEPEVMKKEEVKRATEPAQKRFWTYIVGGTGGLLIGTGAVFGILASSKESELKSESNVNRGRDEVQSLANDAQNYATMANIFYGAGAACIVSATVLFFVEGKSGGVKPSAVVTPIKNGFIISYSRDF
jgi:tetratricopeptide (TPR) repeat protein